MVRCIVLWAAEPLHGVGSHIVALAALVGMLVCGIVPTKELRQQIAWDSPIFIGCVLGLAAVFAHLGIDAWIIGSCEPLFRALSSQIYLLIGVSVYAMVNPWFVLYQNPIYLTAYYATDGEMVELAPMARYCALYLLICLAGLMASVPYWQLLGIL